jgi:hypothetical protein
MSRPNPAALGAFLVLIIAAMGGVALMKGGFFVAKHEGDTLHLMQIVFRMAEGEWPHLDFMTPIGVLAFWPIAALVEAGQSIGAAILWSQIVVACALLLPTLWAAYSRFDSALAYLFGLSVMVLALALVHGQADQLVSISMHCNRWAWAVSYIVVILAVLPGVRAQNATLDGAVIGLGLAVLALIKVTYFIAFAPVAALALALRRDWTAIAVGVVAGLLVVALITLQAGVAFWLAYIGDVLAVAQSDVRPQPGMPLQSIVGAPAYLGGTLVLIFSVVLLRQAGEERLGLLLLLLVPGFIYVTFQNFGNDPQWLVLLALLLLAAKVPAEAVNGLGWPLGRALTAAAVASLAFAAPSFLNLAYSPFRHLSVSPDKYTPFLAANPQHNDLHTRLVRANRVDGVIALDEPGSGLEDRRPLANRDSTVSELNGEVLPYCELQLGIVAWFEAITSDLEAAGYGGAKIFAADIFVSHWLFGDVARLDQGAPWYYGDLAGIEDAAYVLVPLCPASLSVRTQILEELARREIALTEVHRSALYILARVAQTP